MKARHKKTGREITILGISKEWGTATFIAEGMLHQENLASGEWEIIDESEPTDWQTFRREAAKGVLCAIVANNNIGYYGDSNTKLAASAIAITDELIKQLKQE